MPETVRTVSSSPVADKVFRLDPATALYTGYKEFTPRSIKLDPEQFMEKVFTDVLPRNVADSMDRAIFNAKRHYATSTFTCAVFGHWVKCHVIVREQAHVNCTVLRQFG